MVLDNTFVSSGNRIDRLLASHCDLQALEKDLVKVSNKKVSESEKYLILNMVDRKNRLEIELDNLVKDIFHIDKV